MAYRVSGRIIVTRAAASIVSLYVSVAVVDVSLALSSDRDVSRHSCPGNRTLK